MRPVRSGPWLAAPLLWALTRAALAANGGLPPLPTLTGSGPPAAGSGAPGQVYIDTTAHAEWLNSNGTWVQIGIFTAPTAAPISPAGASSAVPSLTFSIASNSALLPIISGF